MKLGKNKSILSNLALGKTLENLSNRIITNTVQYLKEFIFNIRTRTNRLSKRLGNYNVAKKTHDNLTFVKNLIIRT